MHIALALHRIRKNDGHGRVNYEVIQGALRHGHRVTVLAAEVAPEIREHPQVTWRYVPWSKRYTTLMGNLLFAIGTTRFLKKHNSEFDVIKLNGFTSFYPAHVNAVHTIHEVWRRASTFRAPNMAPSSPLRATYLKLYIASSAVLEHNAFHKAHMLVAVSQQVKQELMEYLTIPPQKIRVILNGVDLQEFCPGQVQRTSLGLPEGMPLALFVGDIRTYIKNLDTVLKALQQVPALHLAVAGDTQNSPFPALTAQLGVDDRVHFLGFRRDIPQLMRAADLFVFPSRYEACSLVLLEALASGLPIVTTQTAGGCELVTPDCGIVLPNPNDAEALGSALRELIKDPDRLRCMGRAGRYVAEHHSWETMAQKYLQLFEELATL